MFRKSIILFPVTAMVLAACSVSGKASSTAVSSAVAKNATAGGSSTAAGGSVPKDLGFALNLAIGTDARPSVFSSYHVEVTLDVPKANTTYSAVVNAVTTVSADVQGKNVHVFQTDPGATAPSEGYIIGDTKKEYKMVGGSPKEMIGQIAVGWSFWPLSVVSPYTFAASLHAEKTGEETVNGRSALVYAIDSSKGDPAKIAALGSLGGFGVRSSKGTVWIDKETGGMLMLTMEFVTGVPGKDPAKALGEGTGHIQLEISKVGQVTVASPVK